MIINQLKQAGFRITKPRMAVIQALEQNHEPRSAQEIHAKLSDVDLVSVYRVLEILAELGLAQREDSRSVAKYYLSDNAHHHITCTKCGKMKCVPCDHIFKSIKGFTNIKHQLILIGLCEECG
jgi:Fur family ferric uptake transcriptional regulator